MNKATVALVSFESLGDSLIYVMMAENLRRNGYAITLFGNVAYQLRNWLPQLTIQAYPAAVDFCDTLIAYDLVLMSPSQAMREGRSELKIETLRQHFLLICQKAPRAWLFNHPARLENELPAEIFQQIEPLSDANGSIHHRRFKTESVVDITLDYMQEKMGLKTLSASVDLTPPPHLTHQKYPKRIMISPDSAWPEKKDWCPHGFFKLCDVLVKSGYQPVIVVAPNNYPLWSDKTKNRHPVQTFDAIDKLAEFIYESGAVIANDSGSGHLASFLNIPVLTIYRKRNINFHWRPSWSTAKVVCPLWVLPGLKGDIWRPFLTVKRVKKAFDALLMS